MKVTDIIGRKPELETLKYLYESQKSEFLAIYGRRRVGKSFLIEEADFFVSVHSALWL